ncbi:MAG TPA: phosphoribosylanthranilate isomerase, partial [Thermoanaerobaculia bacterium]|nr:phosphoribosylanthranilate isomerase [Thermoanaerobaculia bacterium]
VTREEDAVLAIDLGAAYIGLNFVAGSPRCLAVSRAQEIASAVAGRVPLVGVFVNRPAVEIEEIAEAVGLAFVQLHGDESPEDVARFGARAIKAFRGSHVEEIDRYPEAGGFLFDAPPSSFSSPGAFGGTGRSWDFSAIAGLADRLSPRRIFIAGGIGPENVNRALALSGARIADVCSRVESSPGIKDPALVARLFSEVRHVSQSLFS